MSETNNTGKSKFAGSRRRFLGMVGVASLASWSRGTSARTIAGEARSAAAVEPMSLETLPTGSVPGRKISINGVSYHVGEQGTGDKVALLLHGMPDTSGVWRFQVPALVDAGYRVIAPDLLGYGETDKPRDIARYRGDSLIADVLTLLDTLQLSQVDVVGHDWGGFLSWELALSAPDRVRRHVSISTGHPDVFSGSVTNPRAAKENWYMYLNTQDAAAELYAANDGAFFKSVMIPTHPAVNEVWSRMKEPAALRGMLSWDRANPLAAMYLAAVSGQVPVRWCRVPTLGLWGTRDAYLAEAQMTASASRMSAAWRYQRIEDSSHWSMLDQPELVNEYILGWLSES